MQTLKEKQSTENFWQSWKERHPLNWWSNTWEEDCERNKMIFDKYISSNNRIYLGRAADILEMQWDCLKRSYAKNNGQYDKTSYIKKADYSHPVKRQASQYINAVDDPIFSYHCHIPVEYIK